MGTIIKALQFRKESKFVLKNYLSQSREKAVMNSIHHSRKRSKGSLNIKRNLKSRQKLAMAAPSRAKESYFLANSFLFKKRKKAKNKKYVTQGNQNDKSLYQSSNNRISVLPASKLFKSQNSASKNDVNMTHDPHRPSNFEKNYKKNRVVTDLIQNKNHENFHTGIIMPKMKRRRSRQRITFKNSNKEKNSIKKGESSKRLKKNLVIKRPNHDHNNRIHQNRLFTPATNNIFQDLNLKTNLRKKENTGDMKFTPKSRASKNFSRVAENILNKDKSNPTIEVDGSKKNFSRVQSVEKISNHSSHNHVNLEDIGYSMRRNNYHMDKKVKTIDQTQRTKRPEIDKELLKKFKKLNKEKINSKASYFDQFQKDQKTDERDKDSKRRKMELEKKVEKLRAFRKAQAELEEKKRREEKERNRRKGEDMMKKIKEETTKPETESLMPNTMIKWSSDSWPNLEEELFFGKCIGEGSFARVYEGFDKVLKKWVAIKIIKKKHFVRKNKQYLIQNEVDIIAAINHKNVIKFERLVEDHKRVNFFFQNFFKNFFEIEKKY